MLPQKIVIDLAINNQKSIASINIYIVKEGIESPMLIDLLTNYTLDLIIL